MPTPVPERDMQRAKELRKLANETQDMVAKQGFKDAANRLERRAAKSVRRVGRKRLNKPTNPATRRGF